jgi:hypothetical protein
LYFLPPPVVVVVVYERPFRGGMNLLLPLPLLLFGRFTATFRIVVAFFWDELFVDDDVYSSNDDDNNNDDDDDDDVIKDRVRKGICVVDDVVVKAVTY